jgi:hypothetical protein
MSNRWLQLRFLGVDLSLVFEPAEVVVLVGCGGSGAQLMGSIIR